MSAPDLLDKLPGADLVRQGIRDTQAGRLSVESCLVEIARPRLERSGLLAPATHRTDSEIQLYRLLGSQTPNPHGRFNSLLRELISLEHALDHRMAKNPSALRMKTEPHTKPQSHEEKPSRRSAPTISHLRASAPPREPFYASSASSVHSVVNNSAFSLVELLVVMAIIGMMVGLSALSVQGMRAPAVQHAADQVMSGLSLARQVAITKNTQAALLIADKTSTGFPTNGPYRHWSVVYSDKGSSGNWTIAKDWEELPNGAFFLEILRSQQPGLGSEQVYNNLSVNDFSLYRVGTNFTPTNFFTNTFSQINAVNGATTNTVLTGQSIPCLIFSSSGTATNSGIAIRIAQGNVMSGNVTLTSTNKYFFIETDSRTGRIRMRSPESYY